MTASPTIRPAGKEDSSAIENLTAHHECLQWGGLPPLTAHLLADRWRQPNVIQTFIQVVETDSGLQGYSDIYQVSLKLARFHGVATDVAVAASLFDWTCDKTSSQGMTLQTSLSTKEEGRTFFQSAGDHPLYSLLAKRGFSPISTTRVMRLLPELETKRRTIPPPYRLVEYNESLLSDLIATYYSSWPKDYYDGDDTSDIVEIFREANPSDLRLAVSDAGDVVGYVLVSRTTDHGVIDEVAVHPSHRRKGLGEALTQWAIRDFGERQITLVVMDENPARYLYEKLGFVVWEERFDLILPGR